MTAQSMPSFRHRCVELGEIRIHDAEVEGAGPPMVLLHGIGMDWRVWQAVSRRLHPYFHLHLVDMRGHGRSEKPAHGYSLAHYAADIEDLIDALELRGVVLLGSSLGGMVAAAVEAPRDVVAYRVLVDPPITGGPVRDPEQYRDILKLKHEPVDRLAAYLRTLNPGAGSHLLRTMSEMWHEASDGVIQDMLARSDDYLDIDHALALDESPTLLLQADPNLGAALSTEQAERALRLLPHGTHRTVWGSGHAIHAYRPREFVDLVTRFTGASTDAGVSGHVLE